MPVFSGKQKFSVLALLQLNLTSGSGSGPQDRAMTYEGLEEIVNPIQQHFPLESNISEISESTHALTFDRNVNLWPTYTRNWAELPRVEATPAKPPRENPAGSQILPSIIMV